MDKEEVAKIKKAIRLIHHDNKYYEGLNILARLIGWPEVSLTWPETNELDACKLVAEIHSLPHPTKSAPVVDENEGNSKAR